MDRLKHADILPTCFLYLKFGGVWQPTHCSRPFSIFYSAYTTIVVVGYTIMVSAEILNIVFTTENRFQIFQENMYLIFTHTNAYIKIINFVLRRDKVILLIDACLSKNWNPPRDEEELQILAQSRQTARRITLLFATLAMTCATAYMIIPLILKVRILPFNAWYPCNINSSLCYWLAYSHQAIISIPAVLVLVANDCVIAGFMLQISAQLKLLSHRLMDAPAKLKKIGNGRINKVDDLEFENQIIKECVESYDAILKFAELLSKTFIETVFFQFCVTMSVVCTTVYFLAQLKIFSFEFFGGFIYLLSLLMQIFYYCWYGNEIILNSDSVFQSIFMMDWIPLNKKSNKALLTMMTVALTPIELFKGIIVKVNLNAFINIIKISYSIYNVLQSTL